VHHLTSTHPSLHTNKSLNYHTQVINHIHKVNPQKQCLTKAKTIQIVIQQMQNNLHNTKQYT